MYLRTFARASLSLVLGMSPPGYAAPVASRERAPLLDPGPDRPAFGLEHRGALRAQAGAEIPLWGRRSHTRWAVLAAPMLELHNQPRADSFVPNEYWRARIALDTWWGSYRDESLAIEIGIGLEHESDHSTARVDSHWGFTTLNDLTLRELTLFTLGPADVSLGYNLALFVGSCTYPPEACRSYGGTTTAGGGMVLTADFGRAVSLLGWQPFVAWGASGILARDEVAQEERLILHVGGSHARATSGTWQVYGLFFLGHDVGVHRATDVTRNLGLGLRWAPP